MATMSAFRRGEVKNDASSLFLAFHHVNHTSDDIISEPLRAIVADRIGKSEKLHELVKKRSVSCGTIAEYCDQIRKGKLAGGEPEIQALSTLNRTVIRQVWIADDNQGQTQVSIRDYGRDVEAFQHMVCILYNEENHLYQPLELIKNDGSGEVQKIFDRNDPAVPDLLQKFIRDELLCGHGEQSNRRTQCQATEPKTPTKDSDEMQHLAHMITLKTLENQAIKRKQPNHDELSLAQNGAEIDLSNEDYADHQQAKVAKLSTSEAMTIGEKESPTTSIEDWLQADPFADKLDLASEAKPARDAASSCQQTANMMLEQEPERMFRGRTQGDFTPRKATNRKGEPSKPMSARYIYDRTNRPFLNLLIRKDCLAPGICCNRLTIHILTPEIDGVTYLNSYFNLRQNSTDPGSSLQNPIEILIRDPTELAAFSEMVLQLQLQLVLVMLTNEQLMQCQQPLTVFSLSGTDPNHRPITRRFNKQDELKSTYHLCNLRLAITLWTKASAADDFQPDLATQFISETLTANKSYKKSSSKRGSPGTSQHVQS